MKLPISWLNDYVSLEEFTPEDIKEKLLGVGFEVEEIIRTGSEIENVIVGKILDIKKHSEADKLTVCMVDIGSEITTIVTHADNIRAGDLVPVAKDGAKLPMGKSISAAPLRGVMSYGMMCSGKELGIDDTVIEGAQNDGILILPANSEIGEDIKQVLGLDEFILDVSVTANRADCQCVFGLAREIAAAFNKKVKAPSTKYKVSEMPVHEMSVTIEDTELCPRYTGRIVRDIVIEPSPKWMQKRLRLAGLRPINNMVDITNYVLLEMGQPLHAFDLEKLNGNINVRRAFDGEIMKALNGSEYKLSGNMQVIADGEKALALAGIMGGEYSAVGEETKDVLLEAARFSRGNVRCTSRALGLRSDSSARYEKGVDFSSVELGRERALSLIYLLKAGKICGETLEAGLPVPKNKVIVTTAEHIGKLLGISVKQAQITKILNKLDFETTVKSDAVSVTVPLFREDVDNYTDLAEEVIRYYGYDNITPTLMPTAAVTVGGTLVKEKNSEVVKALMAGFGAYEIMTYSFINQNVYDKLLYPSGDAARDTIRLTSPLSEEYSVMRTQLTGGLLSAVSLNLARKNDDFRLFELAKVYLPKALPLQELPVEEERLSAAFVGKNESFYSLKEAVAAVLEKFGVCYELKYSGKSYLHPGISADITVGGLVIGSIGKVHPTVADTYSLHRDVYIAELNIAEFLEKEPSVIKYLPLAKFPFVERDLAVVVEDQFTVGELSGAIKAAGGELIEEVKLFDIYKGDQVADACKSVAFSIKMRNPDKTLVDSEVVAVTDHILKELKEKFNAKLR